MLSYSNYSQCRQTSSKGEIFVMRIQNMFHLSLVCLLGFSLISPSFHSTQSNPFPQLLQKELYPHLENDSIPSSINFLFQYSSLSEKEEIIDSLKPFDPSFFHFYRNFPIGLVSLKQNMFQSISGSNPQLISLLQQSQRIQVIPSIELLIPQVLTQQAVYTPPPVIIGAPGLWEDGIDGTNSKIAIIDSGIDSNHEDFDDRIVFEKSFVSETFGFSSDEDTQDLHGHGTHVAGIAAGSGSSFPGVAYNAELYNLKVADLAGSTTQEALLEAIDEAITQKVDVISISLGFGTSDPWGSGDLLTFALDSAVDSGISVVTSAGNDGYEGEYASITSPASMHKGISVGATNGSTNVVEFSSRGPSYDYKVDPDIVAPGYQIAAPLASGGVLEIAFESIVGIDFDNYIVLSGTSMAAPVVSGAIALLKQQFPTASPSTIRAALQESARWMIDESLYVQGSGLINVYEASGLLQSSKIGSEFEIISSLPRAQLENPIELIERISYPGDTAHLGISIVNGKEGTITWDISDSIRDFIEIDSSPVFLSQGDYHHVIVNVSIPFSTAPNVYTGNISYSYAGKNYFIPLKFTIDAPKANVYLYSHDSYSDDSEFYNYRSLGQILSENKFDMNDYSNTIVWENLSKADIMIISDLEYPLSNQEISYISKFHNQNGSILLATSAFPYFNPDPYIKITEILDLTINLTDRVNFINYTDDGRDRNPISYQGVSLSWEQENPLFYNVDNLDFSFGTGFTVNKSQSDIKNLVSTSSNYGGEYYAIAGIEPIDKGKVLVLGSEEWLYTSSLSGSNGQTFVSNLFNWLKPNYEIAVNSYITSSHELEIFVYNSTAQSNLNIDISFENGTSMIGMPLVFNNISENFYYSHKLGLEVNQTIEVTIKNNSKIIRSFPLIAKSFSGFPKINGINVDYSSSTELHIPSWVDTDEKDYVVNRGLDFSVVHEDSMMVSTNVLISNDLEKTLSIIYPQIESLSNFVQENTLQKTSNNEQSLWWPIPNQLPTGYYYYEVQVWYKIRPEDNLSVLLANKKGEFIISDPEPKFNLQSTIKGQKLEYYREILDTGVNIPVWVPGENIEINLIGDDENSDTFEVYVQFIHYYLWLADRIILDFFEINSSIDNKSEQNGIFQVPDTPIPIPDEEDLTVEIQNQLFIFLIFIRDLQGNYDLEVIVFNIGTSIDFDPFVLLLLIIFIGVISLGAIIIVRKNTAPKPLDFSYIEQYRKRIDQPSPRPSQSGLKHCIYCGRKILMGAKFCGYCGKNLPISSYENEF